MFQWLFGKNAEAEKQPLNLLVPEGATIEYDGDTIMVGHRDAENELLESMCEVDQIDTNTFINMITTLTSARTDAQEVRFKLATELAEDYHKAEAEHAQATIESKDKDHQCHSHCGCESPNRPSAEVINISDHQKLSIVDSPFPIV